MGFYQELSKYYDIIFPPEQAQVDFIVSSVKPGGSVFDVACGSGGYSAELYKRGLKVHACDLDYEMVRSAMKRFRESHMEITAKKVDMTELSKKYGSQFDGVFCIGNSIAHLHDLEQIKRALTEMKSILVEGGSIILQTINFDRVKKYNIKELPEIVASNGDLRFTRHYSYLENGKIAFDTVLNVQGYETMKNRVELYPLYKEELLKSLTDLGYKDINIYGDFNRSDFQEDSYLMVASAKK